MKKIFLISILMIYVLGGFSQTMYCSKIDGEQIIKKEFLTISYNVENKIPNYVGYYLTNDNLKGNVKRTSEDFYADKDVPYKYRAYSKNYSNSGYDRGHMSPAADWRNSKSAMHDSFSMANICPQKPHLNRKWWVKIEDTERKNISKCDTLYVISGEFSTDTMYIYNRIRIPTYFFKTMVGVKDGQVVLQNAWIYGNTDAMQKPEDRKTTIKHIEEIIKKDLYYEMWFNELIN